MKTSKVSCNISHKTPTKWVHVLSGQRRESLWTGSSALTLYSSKLDVGVPAASVQGREQCDIPQMLFSRCFPPESARKRGNWKRIFSLCKSTKSLHHSEPLTQICWVFLQALLFCYLFYLQASWPDILSLHLPVKAISKLFNQANMQLINNNQFRR